MNQFALGALAGDDGGTAVAAFESGRGVVEAESAGLEGGSVAGVAVFAEDRGDVAGVVDGGGRWLRREERGKGKSQNRPH